MCKCKIIKLEITFTKIQQARNHFYKNCTDFESVQKEKEGSKHAFIASWKLKRKDNYYKSTIQ